MTGEQFNITNNEWAIIQQLRNMEPREKLVITKQTENNALEYVAVCQSMLFFRRVLDK